MTDRFVGVGVVAVGTSDRRQPVQPIEAVRARPRAVEQPGHVADGVERVGIVADHWGALLMQDVGDPARVVVSLDVADVGPVQADTIRELLLG